MNANFSSFTIIRHPTSKTYTSQILVNQCAFTAKVLVPSMTGDAEPTAKVLFRVPGEDDSAYVETLWAVDLGNDHYRLANSPFYAYSVSWQDVVLAPFSLEEELPTFQQVVEKSGNRTVRVIFDPPVEAGNSSDELLQGLVHLGCSYEGATMSYMSINVPPDVELEAVRSYLMGHDAQWEHADPRYEELFPEGD